VLKFSFTVYINLRVPNTHNLSKLKKQLLFI